MSRRRQEEVKKKKRWREREGKYKNKKKVRREGRHREEDYKRKKRYEERKKTTKNVNYFIESPGIVTSSNFGGAFVNKRRPITKSTHRQRFFLSPSSILAIAVVKCWTAVEGTAYKATPGVVNKYLENIARQIDRSSGELRVHFFFDVRLGLGKI